LRVIEHGGDEDDDDDDDGRDDDDESEGDEGEVIDTEDASEDGTFF